ncbi:MAG: polysaccharide biosynthesis/export family protein [Planctomycetales bacterium]
MKRKPVYFSTFAVMLAAFTGCSSPLTYRAVELPGDLAAPHVVDASQLDLRQLGNPFTDQGLIYPRDVLTVATSAGDDFGSESTSTSSSLQVTDHGTVDVPLVGTVKVVGLTLSQASQVIRQASIDRQIYVSPVASVLFAKKNVHIVTVAGAVKKAGSYEFRPGACTIAAAIQFAGGLTEKADPNLEVEIPGTSSNVEAMSPELNSASILTAGHQSAFDSESSENQRRLSSLSTTPPQILRISLLSPASEVPASRNNLPDGTVITVRERPDRFISIIGLTQNKSIELPYDRDYHVLDAIAAAGGPKYSPWIANKIKVLRPHPSSGETVAINLTMGEAKRNRDANIALAPGDVVSIEETPLTFTIGTIGALVGIGVQTVSGAAQLP